MTFHACVWKGETRDAREGPQWECERLMIIGDCANKIDPRNTTTERGVEGDECFLSIVDSGEFYRFSLLY